MVKSIPFMLIFNTLILPCMPRLMFIQCRPALIFFFSSCFICTLSGKTTDLPRREYSADSVVTGHIRNCRFEKALEYANYNRKQAIPDSKEDLSWLLTTSEIYLRLGNREAGTAILEEGENILQRLQNPGHMLLFRYSFLKGKHMLFENRLDESLQWMHLAEDHARRVEKPDSLEMAMLYGDLGRVHYMQHEYRPALQYYRQALELQPLCSILGLHEASCLKALMADACWYNNEKSRFSILIQDCLAYLDTIADPLHPSLLEVYLKVYEYQLDFYDRYAISKDLSRNINFILQKFYPADHFYAGMFYCEEARDEMQGVI
jgi:tetratricopeptide (TPR) repeat protein